MQRQLLTSSQKASGNLCNEEAPDLFHHGQDRSQKNILPNWKSTYKIIGHSLMFLDSNINPVSCMEYIEIESGSINNNHVTYFTNQLTIHNFKPLDMEHCKINMGQQFIDIDFEKFYYNNEHFRDIIYSIFIQNTIVKFLE